MVIIIYQFMDKEFSVSEELMIKLFLSSKFNYASISRFLLQVIAPLRYVQGAKALCSSSANSGMMVKTTERVSNRSND